MLYEVIVLALQLLWAFNRLWIDGNAVYRADTDAGRRVVMPDAFGAEVRVNLVDVLAKADGFIRALWLAHVAIDAVLIYQ